MTPREIAMKCAETCERSDVMDLAEASRRIRAFALTLAAVPEARALQRYDLLAFGDASFEFDPSPTGEWVRWADISAVSPAFQVPEGLSVWTLPAGTEIKIDGVPFIV